ncbi:Ig-like domain-containing protein, partial [Actinomycetospora sp.]|uniref:Ig-like domain-containing protein n=1 Tax=Actinomycetospora sp. TaxID=1872135 RepID=UPI002F4009C9
MRTTKHTARVLLPVVVAVLALVSACSGGGSGAAGADTEAPPPPVAVVYAPTANATDVAPKTDVSVSVPDGRLTGVALTPAGGGKAVDGTLSPDGK